ncbi:MAG: putative periplasmic serine endoprotease DegP-like protein [Gemmatales bacterium]|nr:MAG: putative periplasmic serine endoprotease DegP-like protein [Gemmatales bacterium]
MKRFVMPTCTLLIGVAIGCLVADHALIGRDTQPSILARDPVTFRDVVKKVLPAVVSIEGRIDVSKTKQPRRRPPIDFDELPIPEEFRKFFEDQGRPFPSFPDPSPRSGMGSGFVIDPDGVILTNYHVVAGADKVHVEFADGEKYVSEDIKGDRKTDLAIIRIKAKKKLPYLQFGNSAAMEIGDRVLAVGAPFGLAGSVTHGIISAKGRNLSLNMYEDFIQTDAAINPGNSGGPLVNLEGKVIGINSAIKSRSGGFQGVGMAISSNLARSIADKLLKDGVVRRGYLGVQVKTLESEVLQRFGIEHGVVVGQVFDGSPAADGGLKAGDIILQVNGQDVLDAKTLQRLVANLPLDKESKFDILRDGKRMQLGIVIREQPEDFGLANTPIYHAPQRDPQTINMEKLGMELADLTPALARKHGYKDNMSGALITNVSNGSLADLAGLRAGMVISKVDNQPVGSADQLSELLKRADLQKGVLLQVHSPRGGIDYLLLKQS